MKMVIKKTVIRTYGFIVTFKSRTSVRARTNLMMSLLKNKLVKDISGAMTLDVKESRKQSNKKARRKNGRRN